MQRALRRVPDGLPAVSAATMLQVLWEAGYRGQRDRTWCSTGTVVRKRKTGVVTVTDPGATPQKKLIEQAHTVGEALGLAVWGQDEAGPSTTAPHPGASWQPEGQPARQPQEYLREGTAKLLTLFPPAAGRVRVKGGTSSTNAVLHGWLNRELAAVLAALAAPNRCRCAEQMRALWRVWQEGLSVCLSLPAELPPLRLLLVWDNLAGHQTPDLVRWLLERGGMPLYTPLGGSWRNMTESVQRILKRRALDGYEPQTPQDIMDWLEAAAQGWNAALTPFVWGGKRQARRQRAYERRHRLGGSGAYARRPVRRRRRTLANSPNGYVQDN